MDAWPSSRIILTMRDIFHNTVLIGMQVEPAHIISLNAMHAIKRASSSSPVRLVVHGHHASLGHYAVLLWQVGLREGLFHGQISLGRRAAAERDGTVSFLVSPIFLPTRSFIHFEVLSSPPADCRPGTTRGMIASCKGVGFDRLLG